jgi:hypothetical protein
MFFIQIMIETYRHHENISTPDKATTLGGTKRPLYTGAVVAIFEDPS